VRSNFENKTATVEILDLQGIENRREVLSLKLNIYDSTNDCLN
jgi:hypothetical protein